MSRRAASCSRWSVPPGSPLGDGHPGPLKVTPAPPAGTAAPAEPAYTEQLNRRSTTQRYVTFKHRHRRESPVSCQPGQAPGFLLRPGPRGQPHTTPHARAPRSDPNQPQESRRTPGAARCTFQPGWCRGPAGNGPGREEGGLTPAGCEARSAPLAREAAEQRRAGAECSLTRPTLRSLRRRSSRRSPACNTAATEEGPRWLPLGSRPELQPPAGRRQWRAPQCAGPRSAGGPRRWARRGRERGGVLAGGAAAPPGPGPNSGGGGQERALPSCEAARLCRGSALAAPSAPRRGQRGGPGRRCDARRAREAAAGSGSLSRPPWEARGRRGPSEEGEVRT